MKTKFTFLFCVLFLVSAQLRSQVPNFQWVVPIGEAFEDYGYAVTTDPSGNVYTTGYFRGTVDFDPGPGTYTLASAGGSDDVFISKLNATGNLVWARNLGGPISNDQCFSIAVDASGNVYTTGIFGPTADFDPGPGTFTLASTGTSSDIFISKLDVSGNFVWAKSFAGPGTDYVYGIAVDAIGNVYTTGYFEGTTDFDPGATSFTITATCCNKDVFVSKLDALGNFVWARNMGGTAIDMAKSIAVDGLGNVYTTGYFSGNADFDPGAGVYNLFTSFFDDVFISKLDGSGNFVWAKQIGGSSSDAGTSLVIDASNNIYTTGSFMGTADFDPSASTYTLTSSGGVDVFVSKLDVSGNFVWAKCFGGAMADYAYSMAIDATNNSYITGVFNGTADFEPGVGSYSLTSAGSVDAFVDKLDANGNFVWAVKFGATNLDEARGIAIDGGNNVLTTGYFKTTVDFDPGAGTYTLTATGASQDAFVHKISQSPLGLEVISNNNKDIHVYPNPNNGIFILQVDYEIENGKIILINSLGQKVHEQKISHGQNNIISHDLASGLYNYIILRDSGQISNGKVTVH